MAQQDTSTSDIDELLISNVLEEQIVYGCVDISCFCLVSVFTPQPLLIVNKISDMIKYLINYMYYAFPKIKHPKGLNF